VKTLPAQSLEKDSVNRKGPKDTQGIVVPPKKETTTLQHITDIISIEEK
jgi:hypothetical protein